MSSDLVEIEWSIMSSLEMIVKDPISIITYLSALIILSPKLTVFVSSISNHWSLNWRYWKIFKKSSDKGQNKMGEIMSIIDENISGLR